MLSRCPHEKEVAGAVRSGRWPEGVEDRLQAHARECIVCAEIALVSGVLNQARIETLRDTPFPSPGALWWRAQLRRRRTDVERVTRPIALVERLSLVCIPLACIGLAVWNWKQVYSWLGWLAGAGRINDAFTDAIGASASTSGMWIPILLVAALGTLALFGGLALYLLVDKE